MHISRKALILLQDKLLKKVIYNDLVQLLPKDFHDDLLKILLTRQFSSEWQMLFMDIISNDVIEDACLVSSGYIFSRKSIEELVNKTKQPYKCPITGNTLLCLQKVDHKLYYLLTKVDQLISCLKMLGDYHHKFTNKLSIEKEYTDCFTVEIQQNKIALLFSLKNGSETIDSHPVKLFLELLMPNARTMEDGTNVFTENGEFRRHWSCKNRLFTVFFIFPTQITAEFTQRTFTEYHLQQWVRCCAELLNFPTATLDCPVSRDFAFNQLGPENSATIFRGEALALPEIVELIRRFIIFTNRITEQLNYTLIETPIEHSLAMNVEKEDRQPSNEHKLPINTNHLSEKIFKSVPIQNPDSLEDVLASEWIRVVCHNKQALYFELILLKSCLADKAYIQIGFHLLFNTAITLKKTEKEFVQLILLWNFSLKIELKESFNTIHPDTLPHDWHEDYLFWQALFNDQLDHFTTKDQQLSSLALAYRAQNSLKPSQLNTIEAAHLCEKALARNEFNAKAQSYLIYSIARHKPLEEAVTSANKWVNKHENVYGKNTILSSYLNALLAKYIYLPYYLETGDMLTVISALGIMIDEPFMRSEQARYIHYIQSGAGSATNWFYIRFRPSVIKHLDTLLQEDETDLANLGTILYAGVGKIVPANITQRIYREYCLSTTSPLFPENLLKELMDSYNCDQIEFTNAANLLNQDSVDLAVIDAETITHQVSASIKRPADLLQGEWQGKKVMIKFYNGNTQAMIDAIKIQHQLTQANPFIINLLGYVPKVTSLGLVMEYGHEGSLESLLLSDIESIPWSLKLKMAHQITCGLRQLHHNDYVHDQLQASKIILFDHHQAKISGFFQRDASAAPVKNNQVNNNSVPISSMRWQSPEQIKQACSTVVSKADNIWSLGMLFFTIASRFLPFHEASTTEQIKSWITDGSGEHLPDACEVQQPEFATLAYSCWAKPEQRPSIDEVAASPCFVRLS